MRSHGRTNAKLYRLLLRLYPRPFRERHGAEMTRVFLALAREAAEKGMWRRGLFWGRTVADVALNALAERARRTMKQKEQVRNGRPLGWLSGLSLDFKLGVRMLFKHPGLALVGVLGMSVAIAIGAAFFSVTRSLASPRLPLDEGDRVVAIQNRSVLDGAEVRGTYLHDLQTWRTELEAVQELGARRTVAHNMIAPDGRIESVRVAEMTASGFRVARVPPLLGRYLVDEDERFDAAPVVVIGYQLWQNRFAGDPEVLGKVLQLGATPHTIVGVMPEGFAFPVNNRLWTPLRLDPLTFEQGRAPEVELFGRLARGATLEQAQVQLGTIAGRHPATHHHQLRAKVMPYAYAFLDSPSFVWVLYLVQLLVSMILVVIGINVAVLVYARTATRTGEITVRSALGASRARVVTQLFAEALVLASVAALLGLTAARFALGQVEVFISYFGGEQVPFWFSFQLSPATVLYVGALTLLAGVIVGVLPGLRATGRKVQTGPQQLGTGGYGLQLGKTWTVLIVAQVAVATGILPVPLAIIGELLFQGSATPELAGAHELLIAPLHLDRESWRGDGAESSDTFITRYAALRAELIRRLEEEPGVTGVALAAGNLGRGGSVIELEGAAVAIDDTRAPAGLHDAVLTYADDDFFRTIDAPLLTGRGFQAADFSGSSNAVIVNQAFVEEVLAGGNAVGHRVRQRARGTDEERAHAPWYEIVGVVPTFPAPAGMFVDARIYHPLVLETTYPLTVVLRVQNGMPATYLERVRELALAVDPMLRLGDAAPLTELLREQARPIKLLRLIILLLAASTLVLSAAGIYALVSFTVTRRRREIGLRLALGAPPSALLLGVLAKAFRQIGLGVLAGFVLVALLLASLGQLATKGVPLLLVAVVSTVTALGFLAALGPARRGLRVPPTEALKSD